MLNLLRLKSAEAARLISCAVLVVFLNVPTYAQVPASCEGYPVMKHEKVSGLNLANGFVQGMLVYKPDDYAVNVLQDYPVIIYLHGLGAMGNGSSDQLCRIFSDAATSLPGKLESGEFSGQATYNGTTYKFLVISPQYNAYNYPTHYPSAAEVDAIIDYVVSTYRVDESRIFLTGMSTGANMVIEYAAASVENARRVAGISLASICSKVENNPQGPSNIAEANLATNFMHCSLDGTLPPPEDVYDCFKSIPENWVNGINAEGTSRPPRYTLLDNANADPFKCNGFYHDTWSTLYNPNVRVNGTNMYEYFLQFQSTLPARVKAYDVRLTSNRVNLRWTTTQEIGTVSFTIERAGKDQRFTPLATIPAAGNSAGEKTYEYNDTKPLADVSYYRIVQTDENGNKEYYAIKKVLNRSASGKRLTVLPNPFVSDLSAFINIDKKQKVTVTLTDMNGRRIREIVRSFDEGVTELSIPTPGLTKGIYLLRVQGETISEMQKVIRQ